MYASKRRPTIAAQAGLAVTLCVFTHQSYRVDIIDELGSRIPLCMVVRMSCAHVQVSHVHNPASATTRRYSAENCGQIYLHEWRLELTPATALPKRLGILHLGGLLILPANLQVHLVGRRSTISDHSRAVRSLSFQRTKELHLP